MKRMCERIVIGAILLPLYVPSPVPKDPKCCSGADYPLTCIHIPDQVQCRAAGCFLEAVLGICLRVLKTPSGDCHSDLYRLAADERTRDPVK